MIKGLAYGVADAIATVLAALIGLARPIIRPLARVLHLARLRAGVVGRIPVNTQFEAAVRTTPGARVSLGGYCRFGRQVFLETCHEGSIDLGSHVTVNSGCVIASYARVQIGDHCLIGEYTSIRDANHGTAIGQPMRLQDHVAAPIVIEDDVWIGRGSVILKGVHIGAGAIVGANSVVTGDVPSMAVVVGAPAKPIMQRSQSADSRSTAATDTPR